MQLSESGKKGLHQEVNWPALSSWSSQPLQLWENTFLLFKPPSLRCVVKAGQTKTLGLSYPGSCNMRQGGGCLVTKSCLSLCDPMDCSLPGSSVHGISQARVLEWVAISSSRGSSWPGIEPTSPALAGGFFTTEPPGKPQDKELSLSFLISRMKWCNTSHNIYVSYFWQVSWIRNCKPSSLYLEVCKDGWWTHPLPREISLIPSDFKRLENKECIQKSFCIFSVSWVEWYI